MFIDNEIIRFKNGVNNRPQGDIFNSMKQPDPTMFSQHAFDFLTFNTVVTAQPAQTIEGTLTADVFNGTPAAGSIALFAGTQGIGGRIICTTGASAGDDLFIHTLPPFVSFSPDKRLFFKVIGSLDELTDCTLNIGIYDGSDPEAPVNGVWFSKTGSDAFFDDVFWTQGGNGDQMGLTNQPQLVAGDDFEVSLYWNGANRIWAGINGAALGTADLVGEDFPFVGTAGNLRPFVYLLTDVAATKRVDLDLIYWAQERTQIGLEL